MTSTSKSSERGGERPSPVDTQPSAAQAGPIYSELDSLPPGQPPPAEAAWLHGREPAPDQVRVFAGPMALQQIAAHSHSDLGSEVGGALLGRAYRHGAQVFVEVLGALPATSRDHGPVHFTFTADSWTQLHQDRAIHFPDLGIVGWFHTHPGLGVFYSGDDVIVHSAAFTLPWHVGLVVDPIRHEACFFGWVKGELAPLEGFYELRDVRPEAGSQPEPVVDWRVVRTSVWHDRYEYEELYQRQGESASSDGAATGGAPSNRVYTPPHAWSGLPSQLSWIAGALALLVSFFLLVGWVLPLSRQVDRLESLALALADEALATSNAAACPDPRLRLLSPLTGQAAAIGDPVSILGTADHPDAARYRMEMRPSGTAGWDLLATRQRSTSLGELATWDTRPYGPGLYELRLMAVDRNNVRLAHTAACIIEIQLIPNNQ